jgi:hypothetical protein
VATPKTPARSRWNAHTHTRYASVGTTTGESKGSDCDEVTRGGIAARNQEFFQHQRKGKERADAEAAQEKHTAQLRLSPATQYGNPMMQQQQQQHQERHEAEEAETVEGERGSVSGRPKNHMIREQMRTHNAAGGRGQGGVRGGGVRPLNVGTVARSTSIVLE